MNLAWRIAAYSAAVLALGCVFALYLQADFLVQLANAFWLCL
jgi:hypothetical protein